MNEKIKKMIVGKNDNLREVMRRINISSEGIALVVERGMKLCGIITDGDIRRALLDGKSMETPANAIMNKHPLTMPQTSSPDDIMKLMIKNSIRHIPLINKHRTLCGIEFLSELKNIPLSSPDVTSAEIKIINQVLSTPYLSIGPKVIEFERKIAKFVGTKHSIAVNSGTSALHLCVRALGIGDGDEIITTPFSFIASANCALYERAKPVFADIDDKTLCIDPDKIESKITRRTKAILPVHVFGYPCDMDKIMKIARRHGLAVIEDACESLGTKYKNKMTGAMGDAGVFAFYPNKQITTGEGGMIVTNDDNIAKLARSMRNQGRDEHSAWLRHRRLGYNYRMSELSAALGSVQTDRIQEILSKRRNIAAAYNERLKDAEKYVKPPYDGKTLDISWFVYVVRLNGKLFGRKDRDAIMAELKSRGVACSNYFPPIHLEPFYVTKFGYERGDFPVAERASDSTIALPFYGNLEKKDIDHVCQNFKDVLRRYEKIQ